MIPPFERHQCQEPRNLIDLVSKPVRPNFAGRSAKAVLRDGVTPIEQDSLAALTRLSVKGWRTPSCEPEAMLANRAVSRGKRNTTQRRSQPF